MVAGEEDEYDRPLLVSEQEKLLTKPGDVQLPQSTPVFMFMKMAGAGSGINLVFDTAATGLVTLHHVPGWKLKATKCQCEQIAIEGLGKAQSIAQ